MGNAMGSEKLLTKGKDFVASEMGADGGFVVIRWKVPLMVRGFRAMWPHRFCVVTEWF